MDAPRTEVRETHVSWVFLVGDRAYKLKKPIRLDVLDFTKREAREAVCHREVELNRRLAPDVYLGVADVLASDGTPCDHLVVMRRLPDERRLATLVQTGSDIDPCLRALARLVAAFHERSESTPAMGEVATAGALLARWEENARTMAPYLGRILDPETAIRVLALARRYLAGRGPLLEARIAGGFVRDGHGDLLADDVFCLEDGPRVLDCIEFDDRLRWGDVLADVAFLAMDLERLGSAGAAERFLHWYLEFAGEWAPATLLHHYIAYRAQVRAKVACFRAAQCDARAAEQAETLLELACHHLELGRVTLALVGGLPGTGKSTVAGTIAGALGTSLLRSDEVRKDLAGLGHTRPAGDAYRAGLYSPTATDATYRELLDRAGRLLAQGESVVLDASWSSAVHREAAARLAADTATDLVALRCECDPGLAARRVSDRTSAGCDASDATAAVAAAMARDADPWPDSVALDTSARADDTARAAISAIRAALAARTEERR